MKKILILVILSVITLVYISYKVIIVLAYKDDLSKLNEYYLVDGEQIIEIFKYENHKFIVTKYYDNSSSWSYLNLLVKDKSKYYMLDTIKKCDSLDNGENLYAKNNNLYIHCIGKNGNIDKYTIKDLTVEKENIKFNYKNTPNISQLNIEINKIDNDYIYLSSPFKMNYNSKEEPKVKCSLKNKTCSYS